MTIRTNFSSVILQETIPDKCANPTRKLKDGTIEEMPPITIYCGDCGRRKLINPSCGKRNCKRCQFKRARKLERKYLPAILGKQNKPGHMWTFVNLTGIHFTVETDLLNDTLRRFGNAMQKFLSEEYEEGGLAVIEHTKSYVVLPLGVVLEGFDDHQIEGPATIIDFPPQLYIHGHALCYGGFKSKAGFEERWGLALVRAGLLAFEEFKKERENAIAKHPNAGYEKVEGLRYVGIEAVRNPKASIRYILKYVAKGVELTDEYLEALKRLKYVRSWGFLYKIEKEPSYDLICEDCGGKCYFILDEALVIESYGNKPEPLRFRRVLREVAGPP